MRLLEVRLELVRRLEAAGLDLDALDPWEAWKVFKAFLHSEVEGGHDAASVQAERYPAEDPAMASLLFMRQFSERDATGEDWPFFHVTLELRYNPEDVPSDFDAAVWTHDYPTCCDPRLDETLLMQ